MRALALVILSLVARVTTTGPVPVSRSGLAGVDNFPFYDPYCGHGHFRSFSPFKLDCSMAFSPGGLTTGSEAAHHLTLCRASSFPYLSSIVWCMHLYCTDGVRASRIENFWETQITGDVKILLKWIFGQVMASITEAPTMVAMNKSVVLNMTILTTRETFDVTWTTLYYFFRETALESYFEYAVVDLVSLVILRSLEKLYMLTVHLNRLALCLTAFGLPIALTWVGYFPFMGSAADHLKPYLYPSIFGRYHDRPLPFLLGNVPTLGQTVYITLLCLLNIIFLAVDYKTLYPERKMQWYTNQYQELMAYFMWRTGVLAFCQTPILFLFATRKNVLLWLTNWSHSTFMLLHR